MTRTTPKVEPPFSNNHTTPVEEHRGSKVLTSISQPTLLVFDGGSSTLDDNEMSQKSLFATQKALKDIGGGPKSVRKLRSRDVLIETESTLQSKLFMIAKKFFNFILTVTPHKSLNSCRGVISEPGLFCASETEILEIHFEQGVTQAGRCAVLLARWIVRSVPLEIVGSSGHEKVPTREKPGLERPGRPRGERIDCGPHSDSFNDTSRRRRSNCSTKISRYLAEANLKSKRPFRALPLTPEHRQLRLQWCQARSMWNVTDWQKVVLSDESRFVLGTNDNRVRVWRHLEHVWDQLKRQMPSCHSVHDLDLAVQDLWAHLPQDKIRCLINSMPDRVAACIAAGGGPTHC
ncbi:uncharacterized protein TNCV_3991131 [Trichonephila clavipes]|uniref:Transposase Tc1-like domain-containing protein n=1 Tax=Trichonephila clavipes TaxID=2585209 RepID=A0A8X6VSL9_TRICX|nr:uncharacterized protein TNCV_3991131 [Trichonephila clavipes]